MHRKKYIFPVSAFGVCVLVILFITTGFSSYGQEVNLEDTVTSVKKDEVEIHSPRKATIYSAVLPGLGQIYNRKYWKVPLVYGGFATLGYFINFNNEKYIIYKQAYFDISDNDPTTSSYLELIANPREEKMGQYTETLRSAKDYWRRNRDLLVIFTGVFYALNIIDASVDAHFFKFDISDDLTMKWVPGPVMCVNERTIGVHCSITF